MIMPSGSPVNGTSVMDDLTSLSRQLVEDRNEEQYQRESDRELRPLDDERPRTHMFEEMHRRIAAASEVASGVPGERSGPATSAGEIWGVSSSGRLPALGEVVGLPRSGASSSVDYIGLKLALAIV